MKTSNRPLDLCATVTDWSDVQAESKDTDGDAPPKKLRRFSMVAYTGGPMRIAGWRYPVVVDLAGPAILRRGSGRIGIRRATVRARLVGRGRGGDPPLSPEAPASPAPGQAVNAPVGAMSAPDGDIDLLYSLFHEHWSPVEVRT